MTEYPISVLEVQILSMVSVLLKNMSWYLSLLVNDRGDFC